MSDKLLITVKDKTALKILQGLEEMKAIKILSDPTLGLSPKKKKQAKDFLGALKQAKLAGQGKIKLKTAQSLINEL